MCEDVFGTRIGLVPYVRPGFGLAKAAATTFDKNPNVEGLILDKHGIFTFGASAKEAYERMIELVSRAEERLAKNRKTVFAAASLPQQVAPHRGGCADRPRCLQPEERRRRRRASAHGRGISDQRRDPEFRQRRGAAALWRVGRHHAGLRDPHQAQAADPARAGSGQARPVQDRGNAGRRGLRRCLQEIFREPQRPLRRRQADARSPAPRGLRARAWALRPRPLGEGRADRRRSRAGGGHDDHRRRGDRPLPDHHRGRRLRRRILADGAGQARQDEGAAARRPGRGDHRRRRRDRRGDRTGVCQCRC